MKIISNIPKPTPSWNRMASKAGLRGQVENCPKNVGRRMSQYHTFI